jgi:hypothetical protein
MNIIPTSYFLKQFKRLAKKHVSLLHDMQVLNDALKENPTQGTALGRGAFKIRLSITSKKKGKSGGARVITCFRVLRDTLYLLDIYDKSERENIEDEDLNDFIDMIDQDLL